VWYARPYGDICFRLLTNEGIARDWIIQILTPSMLYVLQLTLFTQSLGVYVHVQGFINETTEASGMAMKTNPEYP